MSNAGDDKPVLILGAGVNGAALARELLLNGVPVCLVDRSDLASGATAKSSRLIHGGLRYLEYGDVRLVRESLAERSRLHRLAPHLVKPLPLAIPVRKRFGGMMISAVRFIGGGRRPGLRWLRFLSARSPERGLLTVRLGLKMYDRIAKDRSFPPHEVRRNNGSQPPHVDPARYHWLCSYTDGQMTFPERFVIELLEDARQIAKQQSIQFDLHTYATVTFVGTEAVVRPVEADAVSEPSNRPQRELRFAPAAVINATGAWGDETLKQLGIESERLFGGTKGSHFISYQPALRSALGDGGVYAEAADGRLVFVLPYREGVLVGTTDERFDESPERAVATDEELGYLIVLVNELFPGVDLGRDDIEMHYSGVRPLPFVEGKKPSAVTRDHQLHGHPEAAVPTFTLVGGKLTTARAFADDVTTSLLLSLGRPCVQNSRYRALPGGVNYPADSAALTGRLFDLSSRYSVPLATVQTLWDLFGNRSSQILSDCRTSSGEEFHDAYLAGTPIPLSVVRWVIEQEWVSNLDDLIERRLLLLDRPGLRRETLNQLAQELIAAGRLLLDKAQSAVEATITRLRTLYGKTVHP